MLRTTNPCDSTFAKIQNFRHNWLAINLIPSDFLALNLILYIISIITLIDKITKSVNSYDFVISVFIDLKKSFDCVPTNILLAKLQTYAITNVEVITSNMVQKSPN